MATYLKKYTCSNLRVFFTHPCLTTYASWTRPSIVSNKRLVHGFRTWVANCWRLALLPLELTHSSTLFSQIPSLCMYSYTWMISLSPTQIIWQLMIFSISFGKILLLKILVSKIFFSALKFSSIQTVFCYLNTVTSLIFLTTQICCMPSYFLRLMVLSFLILLCFTTLLALYNIFQTLDRICHLQLIVSVNLCTDQLPLSGKQ